MAEVNSKSSLIDENKEVNRGGEKSKKFKRDPIKVKRVCLNSDFYALTWNACRKNAWEAKDSKAILRQMDETNPEIRVKLTESDDFLLRAGFCLFLVVVLTTVGVLLYESFALDAYKDATWPIVILRITLVSFSQELIKPEIFQGISLLRYTYNHESKFTHPFFAKFVALSQTLIAGITFWAIFFFCCMADEALELIMNFAGLAVISELDDWVGDQIMSEKLNVDYEDKDVDFTDINEKMGLFTKLCIIGEDLEIIDDRNDEISNHPLYGFFSTIGDYLPYSIIPLLTIPFQYILHYIQEYGGKAHQKKK